MPCEEDNNCVPCSTTPCPDEVCPDVNYQDVQCATTFPLKCAIWTGEPIECLNIDNGDNGDVVITKIMQAVCDSVINSPDNLFRISAGDTTSGYFQSKVLAGTGVTLTKNNTGANETITISVNGALNNTPLVVTSTDGSISSTLTGTANHTANLGVIVSTDTGNALSKRSNGLFAADASKLKISSIDTTADYLGLKIIAGGNISIIKLNSGADEVLQISTTTVGLTVVTTVDTNTLDISGTGTPSNPLSAAVKISTDPLNTLTADSTGLLVLNSDTFTFKVSNLDASAGYLDDKITAGTLLTITHVDLGGGVLTSRFDVTETPIVVTDTSTIDFTASGSYNHTITASVKVSTQSYNLISVQSDGIYSALIGTGLVKSTGGTISYITDSSANWDIAYANRITSLTTTGASGPATLISNVLNIPAYTISGLGGVPTTRSLTINGSAQTLAADRTWTITVTGTSNRVTVTNGATITPTIDIAATYVGQTSITTLGTIATGTWQGTVINNAYLGISLTTTGNSGAATYVSGVLNIPNYTATGLGAVPTSRILTINGTALDLSANRSWSVGTVTSVGATAGTGISISGSPVTTSGSITITNTAPDQTVVLTAGTGMSITGTYPSFTITNTSPGTALSGTGFVRMTGSTPSYITGTSAQYVMADGSISSGPTLTGYVPYTGATGPVTLGFNNLFTTKYLGVQDASTPANVFLLNQGTPGIFAVSWSTNSGASSLGMLSVDSSGNTAVNGTFNAGLASATNANIVYYNSSTRAVTYGLNPISGTTNYVPKFTGANTIGNSAIYDTGSGVSVGNTTAASTLDVTGTFRSYITQTYSSGTSYAGSLHNIATYTGTLTTSNASFSASENVHFPIFNGATTVNVNTPFGCVLSATQSSFSVTGTVTANSPISCLIAQTQDAGTINGTITASAGVEIKGIFLVSGATAIITRTNHYQLYISDTNQFGNGGNITNKFAIYQAGTSDISRFFGPVQNASSSVQFTSDLRGKNVLGVFGRGLAEIEQIDTHIFTYKYDPSNRNVVGLVAQELEVIMPEAVSKGNFSYKGNDGQDYDFDDYRMIDQTYLFYTMLNAIKELSAKVKVLENK